jgi:3-dehydroshikimate dehydratase
MEFHRLEKAMKFEDQSKIRPGLVSVTFRSLSARQIVELAAKANLAAIEWGGDVHVPHGDLASARAVRQMCEDSGLAISAYGSYFRPSAGLGPSMTEVLDTAAELRTGMVRVWAGTRGSSDASAGDRALVVEQLAMFCDLAAKRKMIVATEFHAGTLTDDVDSCLHLLDEVNRPNLQTMWQPPNGMGPAESLAGLRRVRDRLAHLHVFHWYPDDLHRCPLVDGSDRWPAYLQEAADQSAVDGRLRYASLEFVREDSIEQFHADAATLLGWLGDIT